MVKVPAERMRPDARHWVARALTTNFLLKSDARLVAVQPSRRARRSVTAARVLFMPVSVTLSIRVHLPRLHEASADSVGAFPVNSVLLSRCHRR